MNTESFSLPPDVNEFAALADNLPEAAWIAKADGWIYWYNQQCYNYTGKTPAEMEGCGWQSVHHPDALPEVLERWKDSITTGEPFEMVFPLRGRDGVFRSFLTRVRPWREARGRSLPSRLILHFLPGVVKAQEPVRVQAFVSELAIEALSVGFPGLEKSRMTPC